MNRKTRHLMIILCLIAVTGLVMPVQADFITPAITHVYFEKDGVPYQGSVDYSVNCYGYYTSLSPSGMAEKPAGSYTPELVYHYSATCKEYGCSVYPQYYLKYRHIDWCDLEGKTDNGPFFYHNFSTIPYSEGSIYTPPSYSFWSKILLPAYDEDEEYRYFFYATPEYTACTGQENSSQHPGRNHTAERRIYTSCNSREEKHCFSIFEGYGAVTGGISNYTRFVNATRDNLDEFRFNNYLDTCDPLSDTECGGWILDGKAMKTYPNLFPFRQNTTHLQIYPCDRFLMGINSSLVIPENDRPDGRDHCYERCSFADHIINAYFTIPEGNIHENLPSRPSITGSGNISPETDQSPGTNARSPDLWIKNLNIDGILLWQKKAGHVMDTGNEAFNKTWTQVSKKGGSALRQSHSSVVMPDGSIILMGGNDAHYDTNDVWRSTDSGATWVRMTANAGWSARSGHSTVVMPDGSIVLMGGISEERSPYKNDTWRSADYGKTWTLMNASSGWSARSRHGSVVLPDGSIVLMGGYSSKGSQGISYTDTWRSTDYGKTWALMNVSSGWPEGSGSPSVVMPDGSIVLMSGISRTAKNVNKNGNEVWRSTDKGATWMRMTAYAGWTPRYGQSCIMMPDSSIVLMGGEGDHGNMDDMWRSTDYGKTWTQITANAGWNLHYRHSSVLMPDGSIVLVDDEFRSNVWQLQPAGSGLSQNMPGENFSSGLFSSRTVPESTGRSSPAASASKNNYRSPVESLYCSIVEFFHGRCE